MRRNNPAIRRANLLRAGVGASLRPADHRERDFQARPDSTPVARSDEWALRPATISTVRRGCSVIQFDLEERFDRVGDMKERSLDAQRVLTASTSNCTTAPVPSVGALSAVPASTSSAVSAPPTTKPRPGCGRRSTDRHMTRRSSGLMRRSRRRVCLRVRARSRFRWRADPRRSTSTTDSCSQPTSPWTEPDEALCDTVLAKPELRPGESEQRVSADVFLVLVTVKRNDSVALRGMVAPFE